MFGYILAYAVFALIVGGVATGLTVGGVKLWKFRKKRKEEKRLARQVERNKILSQKKEEENAKANEAEAVSTEVKTEQKAKTKVTRNKKYKPAELNSNLSLKVNYSNVNDKKPNTIASVKSKDGLKLVENIEFIRPKVYEMLEDENVSRIRFSLVDKTNKSNVIKVTVNNKAKDKYEKVDQIFEELEKSVKDFTVTANAIATTKVLSQPMEHYSATDKVLGEELDFGF